MISTPKPEILKQEARFMDKYTKIIYWSEGDKKFIVKVPELPGYMADGLTPEEALRNSAMIISEWIETAEIIGREIPEPSGKLFCA